MRAGSRVGKAMLVAGAIALFSSLAHADKAQNRAAADSLFREAVQLADTGKYDEAIKKFGASYELDPARGTLLGLAMAEEKSGRVLDANSHFRALLEAAEKADDKSRVDVAKEHLEALRVRIPSLTVVFGSDVPARTTVTIDGERLPDGAVGSALPINPGDHRIIAKAPDGRTFARMVGVSEGARTKIQVTWAKTPPPVEVEPTTPPPAKTTPPPEEHQTERTDSPPNLRIIGLAVGGAGAILTGISAYLWIDAGRDFDSVSDVCQNKVCPPEEQDTIDRGKSKERWSRITLIGGGLAIAGGVTLFVIGSRQEQTPAVQAVLTPSGAVVRGRF